MNWLLIAQLAPLLSTWGPKIIPIFQQDLPTVESFAADIRAANGDWGKIAAAIAKDGPKLIAMAQSDLGTIIGLVKAVEGIVTPAAAGPAKPAVLSS